MPGKKDRVNFIENVVVKENLVKLFQKQDLKEIKSIKQDNFNDEIIINEDKIFKNKFYKIY